MNFTHPSLEEISVISHASVLFRTASRELLLAIAIPKRYIFTQVISVILAVFFFWLAFLTAVGDGDQSLSHLNLESLTGIAAGNQSSIEGCSLLLFESFIICLSSVSPIFLQEPSMSPYSQKNKSFMLDGTHEEGGYPLHSFL